jgi:hypothetical protein
VIRDADMAAHHRVVGNDDVVAKAAVMRNMNHRHQHAVAADAGNATAGRRATMDRAMLAYKSTGPNLASGRLALVFEILRRQANRAKWEQLSLLTDAGMALDHDVRNELCTRLDHHVWPYGAKWPDLHARAKFGAVLHDRSRVYTNTITSEPA